MARPRRLDADRLAAAYERDARRLLVFFTRRTYDAQLAVDLVGETYARAFELRRRFAGDAQRRRRARRAGSSGSRATSSTRRCAAATPSAARCAAPACRRRRSTARSSSRIEELAALGELRSAVAGALAELAAEQRDAVRLRVVEELDYAQVAGRLGISEQAARARVSRGLRAIAGALTASAPAEATP